MQSEKDTKAGWIKWNSDVDVADGCANSKISLSIGFGKVKRM